MMCGSMDYLHCVQVTGFEEHRCFPRLEMLRLFHSAVRYGTLNYVCEARVVVLIRNIYIDTTHQSSRPSPGLQCRLERGGERERERERDGSSWLLASSVRSTCQATIGRCKDKAQC